MRVARRGAMFSRPAVLTLNEVAARRIGATGGQERRLPGRYGAIMRSVTATRAIRTVIMNASNAFVPVAQRTSQMMRPKVIATTVPMARANGSGRGVLARRGGFRSAGLARRL